jgi:hypothetical protein
LFGLSAFFFSCLSSWLFPGNTESFLLMLAVVTSSIVFVAFFFCRAVPVPGSYGAVPTCDPDSNRLHRTKSGESRHSAGRYDVGDELGTSTTAAARGRSHNPSPPISPVVPTQESNPDENSSLFSRSSDEEEGRDVGDSKQLLSSGAVLDGCSDPVHHVDIRGWALVRSIDFWLIFTMLGSLTGVGLMTIKYVSPPPLWI